VAVLLSDAHHVGHAGASRQAMTVGAEAMKDVHSKLDWATSLHEGMNERFREFTRPGGGDARPFGINLVSKAKPAGLVIVTFIAERSLPIEMGLLAADAIHNTRVALDHTLARLKEHLGGNPGSGSFPICVTEDEWRTRVVKGRNSSLKGLDPSAADLIYAEQPFHRGAPEEDPLRILNKLDNADKHRLLQPAFVYTGAKEGKDLIQVLDPSRVRLARNLWHSGQPLVHGAPLAHFFITGIASQVLRAHEEVPIGFGSGEVGEPVTSYLAMIDRVRAIAASAGNLIDSAHE
jgi:hypothetical protein